MKEELIRIENGVFIYDNQEYCFDIDICKGECLAIYTDDHLTSGTAFYGIFNGMTAFKSGKIFCGGERADISAAEHRINSGTATITKYRFASNELTAWDYVTAIGRRKGLGQRRAAEKRFFSEQSQQIIREMGITFDWHTKLKNLSMLDYYRLLLYKAWNEQNDIILIDRITEILREQDIISFMNGVQCLQRRGSAFFLLDMDEDFVFRYASRVDIVKNRRTHFILRPDDYGERLYRILGWENKSINTEKEYQNSRTDTVLRVKDLKFGSLEPMTFDIRSGEIAFLGDENYSTVAEIKKCLIDGGDWERGTFELCSEQCDRGSLLKKIGTEIGVQIERPDRKNGVLFDNMTALENLSSFLLPKAGKYIIRKKLEESIADEASDWFERGQLLNSISSWSMPQRLKLTYYKWYLMNPKLLVCLFPFAGLEPIYHELVIDMLVTCAERGMAVWIISSGIDAICEKTENIDFLDRLRYI